MNSIIINDLALMKYQKKLSNKVSYFILVGQKFIGIFLTKVLLHNQFPSHKDSTFFALLAIHFLSFTFFHSENGRQLMIKYKRNIYRKLFQQAFKGYGKGLKLMSLIHKGMSLDVNPLYFSSILVIRSCAAALYRTVTIGFFLNK